MARINTRLRYPAPTTHAGATAARISAEQQLRRLTMTAMLWEDSFYCDGITHADAIREFVPKVDAHTCSIIAREAREQQKLRHVPLLIVREMARHESHRPFVAGTLSTIIQRPDELTEFLALYWKDGRCPLANSVKRGLAEAFGRFNEYQLQKYNRDGAVKLRDVLFLCHAKPKDVAQADMWKRLIANELATPDTWETSLSSGGDKRETFERLMAERKLGGMAALRNLRNMLQAGVDKATVGAYLSTMPVDRILPFRFIAAARAVPQWEDIIEPAMLRSLEQAEKLPGRTILIVDISGSMQAALSSKSDLNRIDTACALAVLLRDLCDDIAIYATAGNDAAQIHATDIVAPRRGFALVDAIKQKNTTLGGGGIFLAQVMQYVYERDAIADRVIVITDEQDRDRKLNPTTTRTFGKANYLINIASYRNGVGYGRWTHVDGWSESVVDFIRELEATTTVEEALL